MNPRGHLRSVGGASTGQGEAGDQEKYEFAPDFERKVAALCAQRPKFMGLIGFAIEPACLQVPEAALVVQAAQEMHREAGHGPDDSTLVLQRLKRKVIDGKLKHEEVIAAMDMLDDVEGSGLPDETLTINELKTVLAERLRGKAVRTAIGAYGKNSEQAFEEVVNLVERAKTLGESNNSLGVQLGMASFEDIARLRQMERLPTGMQELDVLLNGGVGCGLLACFQGEMKSGKSIAMNHVGCHTMRMGLNVCYVSTEIPVALQLARAKANLTGVPTDLILDGSAVGECAARLEPMLPSLGRMFIQYFPPGSVTVRQVRDWVDQCEQHSGNKVHQVLYDCLDEFGYPHRMSRYEGMKHVFETARHGLLEEKRWGWTSTQAKVRKGRDKERRLSIEDASDSAGKGRVVDLMITINRTEDDMVDLCVAGSRYGQSGQTTGPLPLELSIGRLVPLR